MVKSIVRPCILCVPSYTRTPDGSVCQSHGVSTCDPYLSMLYTHLHTSQATMLLQQLYFLMLVFSHFIILSRAKSHQCKGGLCCSREYSNAREGLLTKSSAYESLTVSTVMTLDPLDEPKPLGSWRLPEIIAIFALVAHVTNQSNSQHLRTPK